MAEWDRRRFISTAGIAAGSGLAGWSMFGSSSLLAQQPLVGVPDEILNPVEVSGAEAEPVMGKLPGQKRMYVLPNDAGEYHRVGSQVMKRIARPGRHRRRSRARHFHWQFGRGHAAPHPPEQPCRRARDARRDRVRAGGRSLDDDARRLCQPAAGDAARVDHEVRRRSVGPLLDEPPRWSRVHGDGRTPGRTEDSGERSA